MSGESIAEQFNKIDEEVTRKVERVERRGNRTGNYNFKPGVSGNPKGRPKGALSILSSLKKKLNKYDPKTGKKYLDLFVDKYIDMAINEGKEATMRTIFNYIDGMPDQKIDMDFGISKIVINDPNAITTNEELPKLNADATDNNIANQEAVPSLPSPTQS